MSLLFRRLIALSLLFIIPRVFADIAVVTHPENPMANLPETEIKKIFLGIKRKTKTGELIKVIDQYSNERIRDKFYLTFTGKTAAQINSRWAGLLFSGKATPPHQVQNDEQVKMWLQDNKLGFGYIHTDQLDNSVKQLIIIPEKE